MKQTQDPKDIKVKTAKKEPQVEELQAEIEAVTQRMNQLATEAQVLDGKYKRALADYQNLEKRVEEEQQRFVKIATQIFVEQLLIPYDHLLLAAKHIQDKGLDLVIGQFKALFESQGLKEIPAQGMVFDPTKMEVVETKEGEHDIVLEVATPGYELNGVIVRPAMVVVGKKAQ